MFIHQTVRRNRSEFKINYLIFVPEIMIVKSDVVYKIN